MPRPIGFVLCAATNPSHDFMERARHLVNAAAANDDARDLACLVDAVAELADGGWT